MTSIDTDPVPRTTPGAYQRVEISTSREEVLPEPKRLSILQHEVLSRRRSASHFGEIGPQDLSTWLKFTCGLQARGAGDSNRQLRFVSSFGALHPSHMLLGDPDGSWAVYNPHRHSLGKTNVNRKASQELRGLAEDCHPGEDGTLVALVADLDLAENYYVRPSSLLLRDGGVMLGHGSLIAAAIGIPFRILGVVGTGIIESLLVNAPFRCCGTGLAWIGGVRDADPERAMAETTECAQ